MCQQAAAGESAAVSYLCSGLQSPSKNVKRLTNPMTQDYDTLFLRWTAIYHLLSLGRIREVDNDSTCAASKTVKTFLLSRFLVYCDTADHRITRWSQLIITCGYSFKISCQSTTMSVMSIIHGITLATRMGEESSRTDQEPRSGNAAANQANVMTVNWQLNV